MSKLIDAIEAHVTGKRFYAEPKVSYYDITKIESSSFSTIPHLIEYQIDVRIGANTRIEQGQDSGKALRNMSRLIQNHVFGEFRDDIDKIHRALFERDFEKATEALEDMYKRMFSA